MAALWGSPHWQAWWNNGSIALLGLLNLLILYYTLPVVSFGQWGIFITGSSFLELLRTGVVQSALIRYTSGMEETKRIPYLSASLWIGGGVTLLLMGGLLVGAQLSAPFERDAYYLFWHYAPLLLVASFPFMFAQWHLNVKRLFLFSFRLRLVVFGTFTFFVLLHTLQPFNVVQIVLFYLLGHLIASVITLYNGLCDISILRYATWGTLKKMFHFGRYSMGSLTALNLLKSSDTFMLGILASPECLAFYHLPLRLTEWSDLLIRSMTANAYPRLVSVFNGVKPPKKMLRFRRIWGMYLGVTFLFSIPAALLMAGLSFGLAETEYQAVWWGLALSTVLAPFFRFSGVALEALHYPERSFVQVWCMVLLNVIGNLWVILSFQKLWAVALVTILSYWVGGVLGLVWVHFSFPLRLGALFKQTLRWLRWKIRYLLQH